MLADLALILFIVTASHAGAGETVAPPATDPVPQAIYRPSPGAPPLARWIARQPVGEGASLQITIGYDPAHAEQGTNEAARLAEQAMAAGMAPRIVLVPGSSERAAVLSRLFMALSIFGLAVGLEQKLQHTVAVDVFAVLLVLPPPRSLPRYTLKVI